MNDDLAEILNTLAARGWVMQNRQEPAKLPEACAERYSWLPGDVIALVTSYDAVFAPGQQAWLITYSELSGESNSAFSWNQWEQDSLSAAAGDLDWQGTIRSFWDEHFPVLMSVKSGYAYAAIRKDLAIVAGEEPEFEETEKIADDFSSFLRLLATGERRLSRWV